MAKRSKRHIKTGVMDYVLIPVLYILLLFGAGCVALNNIAPASLGNISKIFVAKSLPDFTIEEKEAEKLNAEEITWPSLGEQYGIIRSENAGLEENLCYGDDELTLKKNIGQYENSGFPGMGQPILLAGHNGTIFKQLKYVEIGDIVEIETSYGLYHYEVVNTEIVNVEKWDVSLLDRDEELLMMYTCYPFDQLNVPDRYFVYARFLDGPQVEEELK